MKNHHLHDLAKFGAGLILSDFIFWCWAGLEHMLPIRFMGTTITQTALFPGMAFDAVVFLALVHYGWRIGKTPAIKNRTYLLVAGIVFGIVALAHLLRLFFGSEVVLAGWIVPLWLSWVGVIVTGYLSYMSFHLATTSK